MLTPDGNTFQYLQQARAFLEARYPQAMICTQPIAFPHLGYRLHLEPYGEKCLAQADAVVITVAAKDPYPYSKAYWDGLDVAVRDKAGERYEFGEVHVYSAAAVREALKR